MHVRPERSQSLSRTRKLTALVTSRRLQELPLEHADLHERDERCHLVRLSLVYIASDSLD